jgi:GDPmannose 4,6-dehydratase
MAAARISLGLEDKLYLGNLNALRDWGHAKDYVDGMWRILQADKPDDFVLATGKMTSVRDFCTMSFRRAGIELEYEGEGASEKGRDRKTGKVVVEVDPRYFRPAEVEQLCGDPSKAKNALGWSPKIDVGELCACMVDHDLEEAKRDMHLATGGFEVGKSID